MLQLQVPLSLNRTEIIYLRQHGCRVFDGNTYYRVIFPEGTVEREILPRVGERRYELRLPDGTLLYHQELRYERIENEKNVLLLPGLALEMEEEITEEEFAH